MHLPTYLQKHKAVHDHAMEAYGGNRGILHSFLTSAIYEGGASDLLTPRPLYPRYRNPIPTDNGCVESRAGRQLLEKKNHFHLQGFKHRTVQQVA
jgi:hypothetical protein